ncbi:MAG: SRPBCC family protein [Bacteroidetes bacterium]|nr:SRPBCC family protein [Bacteroidota bacterium]
MEKSESTTISVEATIAAPVEKVWQYWTSPEHIIHWNAASDDWHTPYAENDLRTGGKFKSRMEARDGSMGFDFEGIYSNVIVPRLIEYSLGDDRKVKVEFSAEGNVTQVTEKFDVEQINSVELQRTGWQAILNNFKKYVESH